MQIRRGTAVATLVGLVATTLLTGVPAEAAGDPVDRPEEPVVVTGLTVSPLLGVAPDRVAAFRRAADAWVPVPVQVDERAAIDFGRPPAGNPPTGTVGTVYGTTPIGHTALQYTDASTWVGADPNPALDANDEIVFMARDAGDQAGSAAPPDHVDPITGVELAVTDPLDPGAASWVYLFAHDGSLDPSAGQALVDYDFVLTSGDYRATYLRGDGPNPEDSMITTGVYQQHFSDRWVDDELHITVGPASGVDILDRHRNQFAPGQCGRSEDTFVDAEGAFVVNRVGPVRAIRAYIGANSGPLTERTHLFYEARHEIITDLRVHAISGIMDVFDYSPAAAGMTYRNSAMSGTVVIDGIPDTVPSAASDWELVRGGPGTLISTIDVTTSQAFAPGSTHTYYLDDDTPSVDQCTGDDDAFGVSGSRLAAAIANTDPQFTPAERFRGRRVLTFRAPGATVAEAVAVEAEVDAPLAVSVRRFSVFPPHPFTDVAGTSWVSPALDWAAHHQLVSGFAGGQVRPSGPVQRGQAVNMLWHDVDEPGPAAPHGFPDVPPGAFYEDALDWARAEGLVTGLPDGRFGPQGPVTRGQAVNMVWQMVGQPAGAPAHRFPDVPAGAFYGAALDWSRFEGLVTGFGDGTFRPRTPISRSQFVNLLFVLAGDPDAWTAFGQPPSTVRF